MSCRLAISIQGRDLGLALNSAVETLAQGSVGMSQKVQRILEIISQENIPGNVIKPCSASLKAVHGSGFPWDGEEHEEADTERQWRGLRAQNSSLTEGLSKEWGFSPSHYAGSCRPPTKQAQNILKQMEGNFFFFFPSPGTGHLWSAELVAAGFCGAAFGRAKNRWINECRGRVLGINDKSLDGNSLRELGRWTREWISHHLTCPWTSGRSKGQKEHPGQRELGAALPAAGILLEKLHLLGRKQLKLTLQKAISQVDSNRQQTDGFCVVCSGYCLFCSCPCLLITLVSSACRTMWWLLLMTHGQHQVSPQLIFFNLFLIILLSKRTWHAEFNSSVVVVDFGGTLQGASGTAEETQGFGIENLRRVLGFCHSE